MNILVCLYFSAFLFGHFRRSLTEGSLEMPGVSPLYDLCPYTNYCTRNASKRLKDDTKTACCGYCSCSDNCWKRGNCCVDKQNIIVQQPLESCVEVMVKTGGFHGKPKNLPRYYVIQSCPMTNDTLTENCSGNVQSSLEDFIWVTDERTNKLYNNKYCAECHGVVNYIKWKVGTDCLVPMDGQKSPTDVINGVISMCSLFVLPPEGTDERVNRCFVSELGTCNVTRKWQNYDQALETACNDFNQIYYQEDGFQAYYKNVYCFLCNSRDQEVQDVCTASIQPISKTDLIGFTAILDFDLIESEKEARADDEAKQSRVCPIDEIKDPFQVHDV